MKTSRFRLEFIVLLYFLSYTPYAIFTKLLTTQVDAALGRPLTGLEILPFTLMVSSAGLVLFLWLSGWWKVVPHRMAGPIPIFSLRPEMWFAGVGTALLLTATPLSYTFPGVSIPTVQLLMRGDVLLVAPLVDLIAGRRVKWYSLVALGLVLVPVVLTLATRGVFNFPPLLVVVIAAYTVGYLMRLSVMTRIAKNDDPGAMRLYFVEERIISIPMVIGVLGLFAAFGTSAQAHELAWGFTRIWTSDAVPSLLAISLCLFLVTFFAAMVLLDKHENSYCVPLERSSSIIAGLVATIVLSVTFGMPFPTATELFGAVVLVMAIVVLSVGPMLSRERTDTVV